MNPYWVKHGDALNVLNNFSTNAYIYSSTNFNFANIELPHKDV